MQWMRTAQVLNIQKLDRCVSFSLLYLQRDMLDYYHYGIFQKFFNETDAQAPDERGA